MPSKHRIEPRHIKRFLQLAATALAVTLGPTSAFAEGGLVDGGREADFYSEGWVENESHPYRHRFVLPATRGTSVPGRGLADLRVLDAEGRKVVQLALDGDSMIGPLARGCYTVLLRANGLTEVQRIRIGPGTMPYLHFARSSGGDYA